MDFERSSTEGRCQPSILGTIIKPWNANVASKLCLASSRLLGPEMFGRLRHHHLPQRQQPKWVPQRHVLPKNLRKAVKHLSDEELDLLHAAILEEMKWRGKLPPSVGAGLPAVSSFLALADEKTVAFNW